jgi:hypothetical protein
VSLEDLDAAAFRGQLHTRFLIRGDEGRVVEMELVEVAERASPAGQERFSLVFRGPLDAPLAQEAHALEHDVIGGGSLFLVPIGRDERGYSYEAVFNRLSRGPR